MIKYFPRVRDWQILEKKVIHDFSVRENPIEVVKLMIGTYYGLPIIRWISRSEYMYMLENEDIIIR